ncbi:hypothetical protein [Haloarchaeobius sp. FL176]|uniref:hypothetical protein n=1 Tax=Haloarchaeobius sp. FL176 TaxID=2967129 RepID=UPI0021488039|nr:hypothetical protein [Haloarchaeobius sp. FL176]
MTGDDTPVEHYVLAEPMDLRTALAAAGIEHLEVDDQRTIVIYQQAILMVIATEGSATAAQEFNVEFWKEPPNDPERNPESLFAAFIDELLAMTETTRR